MRALTAEEFAAFMLLAVALAAVAAFAIRRSVCPRPTDFERWLSRVWRR